MVEVFIDHNDLSSALCDIVNVTETLVSLDVDDNDLKKIEYVKNFIESLHPENEGEDQSISIDKKNISECITKLSEVEKQLHDDVKDEPKDNEGSDITVGDCIKDVLSFLQSLDNQ